MKTSKKALIGAALTIVSALLAPAHAGTTFDAVKAKGYVQCGSSDGAPGFSMLNSEGRWWGLDVEMCRAIAAAMFGDANKVQILPLSTQQRFTALQSGEIDVLIRSTTLTQSRDTTLGLIGTGVNFYDSQGIMVSRSMGIKSARELDGATVCVRPGTTTEMNLADWFRANNLTFKPVVLEGQEEIVRVFAMGRCDAYTNDKGTLAGVRAALLENPDDYVILPEDFSKEPLGPMVRQGDEQWFNLVRWSLNAQLEAEEYGITSQNVDEMLKSANPNVQRILGVTPGMGKNLGIDDKWAYHIIKQVGNYGESFEKTMGQSSPMKLERGINAQWRDGGLMYGWPVR